MGYPIFMVEKRNKPRRGTGLVSRPQRYSALKGESRKTRLRVEEGQKARGGKTWDTNAQRKKNQIGPKVNTKARLHKKKKKQDRKSRHIEKPRSPSVPISKRLE